MSDKIERKDGTNRITYLTEKSAFKVARIDLKHVFSQLIKKILLPIKTPRVKYKTWLNTPKFMATVFQKAVLWNIQENLNEARASGQIQEFIVQTQFTVLGLINKQTRAEDINPNIDTEKIFLKAFQSIDPDFNFDDLIRLFGAHFFEGNNSFGVLAGKALIRDYGEEQVTEAIKNNPEAVGKALEKITSELNSPTQ